MALSALAIQLTSGCLPSDLEPEDLHILSKLEQLKALEINDKGLTRLSSLYRIGTLYMSKDGRGFVQTEIKEEGDLLIEANDLRGAKHGDIVVAKRIIARRGRPTGKILFVAKKAHLYILAYTNKTITGEFQIIDIKTGEPTQAIMKGVDLSLLKLGTVLQIDIDDNQVIEILGTLDDPKVDEKISLLLYKRKDIFPEPCIKQAKSIETSIAPQDYPDRIDLTHLNFCTIDPVTAKDFDDAIYFDKDSYALYVAVADVSHYVPYFSPIDKEAKTRGFTTYLPHKAFPMIPRELSENICSLKPRENRLAFVAKIVLDKQTLQPIKEEFFEAVIHSKYRFNYDQIDTLIATKGDNASGVVTELWEDLGVLYTITTKLRTSRLKKGFDFRSEEIKLTIDSNHLLTKTQVETGTPSHSLIEECMLLANQAAAKRFTGENDSIFRIHEPPQLAKIEALLSELASIGLFVEEYEDSPSLIRAIQTEASKLGIESQVDSMVIKSLKQATYSPLNVGHFGLGFKHYSHFTSPIRRYSDLILHRLIKAQIANDTQENEYLLRNIQPLCAMVSELERETTKCEWDFRDRKFARWATTKQGESFEALVIETGESAKAILLGEIQGVCVNVRGEGLMLFDTIEVIIKEVSIAHTTIMATATQKLKGIDVSKRV